MASRIPVVAILNSNYDVVELLRIALEQAGLVAVSAHIDAIRRADTSILDFVTEHEPDAVIYDLVPPYDRSWLFLVHLREKALRGRRVVLTSTNPKRASELAATSEDIYEIVGKPYDIDIIVDAVREAVRARPTRD
jgi:DNA-binding NtrC family response regulator